MCHSFLRVADIESEKEEGDNVRRSVALDWKECLGHSAGVCVVAFDFGGC